MRYLPRCRTEDKTCHHRDAPYTLAMREMMGENRNNSRNVGGSSHCYCVYSEVFKRCGVPDVHAYNVLVGNKSGN
ncbi:hypothetical protein RRG08_048507 [Elysia crispata]|uniref:Uncharacterized protein n=1 Tax=Elysia crispata TaxID=231223 RepID=A0AAE0YFS1_9GAST|nr:hypothetical protein RRG08_048507 [Elysia crispata]